MVGWLVKLVLCRVVSEEVLAGPKSQEMGEEGDYTPTATLSPPLRMTPATRWLAAMRAILMFY